MHPDEEWLGSLMRLVQGVEPAVHPSEERLGLAHGRTQQRDGERPKSLTEWVALELRCTRWGRARMGTRKWCEA